MHNRVSICEISTNLRLIGPFRSSIIRCSPKRLIQIIPLVNVRKTHWWSLWFTFVFLVRIYILRTCERSYVSTHLPYYSVRGSHPVPMPSSRLVRTHYRNFSVFICSFVLIFKHTWRVRINVVCRIIANNFHRRRDIVILYKKTVKKKHFSCKQKIPIGALRSLKKKKWV